MDAFVREVGARFADSDPVCAERQRVGPVFAGDMVVEHFDFESSASSEPRLRQAIRSRTDSK